MTYQSVAYSILNVLYKEHLQAHGNLHRYCTDELFRLVPNNTSFELFQLIINFLSNKNLIYANPPGVQYDKETYSISIKGAEAMRNFEYSEEFKKHMQKVIKLKDETNFGSIDPLIDNKYQKIHLQWADICRVFFIKHT